MSKFPIPVNKQKAVTIMKEFCKAAGAKYDNRLFLRGTVNTPYSWTIQDLKKFKSWLVDYLRSHTKWELEECRKYTNAFLVNYGWKIKRTN